MPASIDILPYNPAVKNPSLERADVLAGLARMRDETKRRIAAAGAWVPDRLSLPVGELPDNAHLDFGMMAGADGLDPLSRELIRHELPGILERLKEASGTTPIVLVCDDCPVNENLKAALVDVLGKEGYGRYVSVVGINWDENQHSQKLEELPENVIVIIGGSFSDTYSIPPSKYASKFRETLTRTMACDADDRTNNRRLLGVCFGNQLLANVLRFGSGAQRHYGLTVKGFGQFGPFPVGYADYFEMPPVFQQALAGVTDLGNVREVASFFTRTGHQKFNIADLAKEPVHVLARESVGGGVTTWGSRNFRALGEQSHPEITLKSAMDVAKRVARVLHGSAGARECYGQDVARTVLSNFMAGLSVMKADSSRAFYLHALRALGNDILRVVDSRPKPWKRPGQEEARSLLVNRIRKAQGVGDAGAAETGHGSSGSRKAASSSSGELSYFSAQALENAAFSDIDKLLCAGKMEINMLGDWEVDRGEAQISKIMGVRLLPFVREYLDRRAAENPREATAVVDMGPGDGTFMRDLRDRPEVAGRGQIVYGVGDRAYVDVESCLKRMPESRLMPDPADNAQILRLIAQDVIVKLKMALELFKNAAEYRPELLREGLLREILSSVRSAKPNASSGLSVSGMFENEGREEARPAVKEFLLGKDKKAPDAQALAGQEKVRALVRSASDPDRFAAAVGAEFRNIWIGHFLNFDLPERTRVPVHLYFASRSTSHVDPDDYHRIVDRFVRKQAADGAVAFENGVYQSYTIIPRLPELLQIQQEHAGRAEISLVYDRRENQFKCAIVAVAPDDRLRASIARHVDAESEVVPLEEAARSTFFRLESLMRRFVYEIAKGVDGAANVRAMFSLLHESTAASANYVMDVVRRRSEIARLGGDPRFDARDQNRVITAVRELALKFAQRLGAKSDDGEFGNEGSGQAPKDPCPLTADRFEKISSRMGEEDSLFASSAARQAVGSLRPSEFSVHDVRLYQDETGESLEAIFTDPVSFPAWMNGDARRKY